MTWTLLSALCAVLCGASPLQIPLSRSDTLREHDERPAPTQYTLQTQPGPCLQGPVCDRMTSLRTNQVNMLWGGLMADISIGTPPQRLEAWVTFGSAPFFVINSTATEIGLEDQERWCDGKVALHCYNDQTTTTVRSTGETASVTFNRIHLTGTIENDMVNIMGVNMPTDFLKVTSYYDRRFLDPHLWDTFLSLSRGRVDSVEPENMQSPIRRMFSERRVDHPTIAFDFIPGTYYESTLYTGTMTVGGDIDRRLVPFLGQSAAVTAVPLDRVDPQYQELSDWQVAGISVGYDDQTQDISKHTVIFQPDYAGLCLPPDIVRRLEHDYKIGSGHRDSDGLMDCRVKDRLPDLVISLANYPPPGPPWGGPITPQDIVVTPEDYVTEFDNLDRGRKSKKRCLPMVTACESYGDDTNLISLGMPVMRGHYTIFRYGNEEVQIFSKLGN